MNRFERHEECWNSNSHPRCDAHASGHQHPRHGRHGRHAMHHRDDEGQRGRGGRGPGWGPGGGRGPMGGGGGRMRVFAHGDLRLVVLYLIDQTPLKGYEIIKKLEALFFNNYSPSPGAVYPILTMLEELGFIGPEDDGSGESKKRFAITEAGKAHLLTQKDELEAMLARISIAAKSMQGSEGDNSIMDAMHSLKKTLLLSRASHNEGKAKEIARIIVEAAQKIGEIIAK